MKTDAPLDPAAVMAEHRAQDRYETPGKWCHECRVQHPCDPYRLAADLAAAQERLLEVETVRVRLLDPTQNVTEGPLIARIKVETWLRRALAGEKA